MTLVTLVTRNRRKRAGRFLVSNLHRHSLPRFSFTAKGEPVETI